MLARRDRARRRRRARGVRRRHDGNHTRREAAGAHREPEGRAQALWRDGGVPQEAQPQLRLPAPFPGAQRPRPSPEPMRAVASLRDFLGRGIMKRLVVCAVIGVLSWCSQRGPPAADGRSRRVPPGIGDPYFPLDGNGGYDVEHYGLDLAYDPPTHTRRRRDDHGDGDREPLQLQPRPRRPERPRHHRRRQGRDLDAATAGELTVTPARGLPQRPPSSRSSCATTACRRPIDSRRSASRVSSTTDDGMVIAGEPDGAATWFPVNDHPLDKASYTFKVTVPKGCRWSPTAACSAGRRARRTTFIWQERDR